MAVMRSDLFLETYFKPLIPFALHQTEIHGCTYRRNLPAIKSKHTELSV